MKRQLNIESSLESRANLSTSSLLPRGKVKGRVSVDLSGWPWTSLGC